MSEQPQEARSAAKTWDKLACPKCGSGDVATRYHRGRFLCNPHSRYTSSDQEGEHLHYTCRNCSYDWTRDVADAAA